MQPLQGKHRRQPLGHTVAVVVCIVLLAVISVVQVTHLHQTASEADHCALCVVMHSTAPIALAAVTVVLVQIGISAPVPVAEAPLFQRHIELFTRPPPRSR